MMSLGRGGEGRVQFHKDTVVKLATRREPLYMLANPDVFVTIRSIEKVAGSSELATFSMPRLRQPDVMTEGREALIEGVTLLKDALWTKLDLFPQPPWREELLEHLRSVRDSAGLETLVRSLPDVERPCAIHGDATLANTLWDKERSKWVYCDPLERKYIPHDPLVDLGKAFQSCWGYESILLGETSSPQLDMGVTRILSRITGLDETDAMSWCWVHVIRLLPYQNPVVRQIFTELLDHVGL